MVQSASLRGRLPDLDKYEVIEEIGHGGMATVFRARDRRLGREVAVKVIHPHLRESTEVAHRFRGEAQAVAKLRHENIVEVYDVSGDGEPEQYLVVELLRGRTLRQILKERKELPPEVAAALAVELLGALAHAHEQGVVHRDVKPENVIVEHDAPTEGGDAEGNNTGARRVRVKLTDFGIAKLLDAQGVTSTGQVLGSPAHMAPEQIEGASVDARADVFGLGVLLYECMVGHLPFEGANPAQVLRRVLDGIYANAERERPKVGRVWASILDRALAREPAQRYADAGEMRTAICRELDKLGVGGPKELLTRYFDDPVAFEAAHEKQLVERLAKLGGDARRDGNHVDAAAYTNRALAYAPNDPALLAIASSLGRRESGMRFLRRGVPLLLGTIAFGVLGFWGSRALIGRSTVRVDPSPSANVPPRVVPSTASATPSAKPSAAPPIPVASVVPVPAPPVRPVASVAPKPAERGLVIRSVRPPFGVTLALDGQPVAVIKAGDRVTTTRDSHTIKLTCASDACEPDVRTISPGEEDAVLDVVLAIRPATLVVEAKSGRFQLREEPTIVFGPREVVKVPMKGALSTMHVVDLSAPDRVERVTLSAGKESRVVFDAPN